MSINATRFTPQDSINWLPAGCFSNILPFLGYLRQALDTKQQIEIPKINKLFSNEMQKHISNKYIENFLNIKGGGYETFFDELMQKVRTSEEANEQTSIIEFHRIISNIIENIRTEIDWDYLTTIPNSFDGGLERSRNIYLNKLWWYKYSVPGKISKLTVKLGNEINTHRANKSLEFDIKNIKNEFYEKIKKLKDEGSTVKFDMIAPSSITNDKDNSSNIPHDIKSLITDIYNIVSKFEYKYGKVFQLPNEDSDKYASDLKNYMELFADTYNQIIDKIKNIHDNFNFDNNLIQNLKILHDSVVRSIGNYLWHVHQINGFWSDFTNKKSGNFEKISIPNNLSINIKKVEDVLTAMRDLILYLFGSEK